LGGYKVQEITKEGFVANGVQVEMQSHHLYIACHATRIINAIATYRTKHEIVNNDMV
jgi:hypothetical protein